MRAQRLLFLFFLHLLLPLPLPAAEEEASALRGMHSTAEVGANNNNKAAEGLMQVFDAVLASRQRAGRQGHGGGSSNEEAAHHHGAGQPQQPYQRFKSLLRRWRTSRKDSSSDDDGDGGGGHSVRRATASRPGEKRRSGRSKTSERSGSLPRFSTTKTAGTQTYTPAFWEKRDLVQPAACKNPTFPLCKEGCCPKGFFCKKSDVGDNFCLQNPEKTVATLKRPTRYKGHGKYEADIKTMAAQCCWPCTDRFSGALTTEFLDISSEEHDAAMDRLHQWVSVDAAGKQHAEQHAEQHAAQRHAGPRRSGRQLLDRQGSRHGAPDRGAIDKATLKAYGITDSFEPGPTRPTFPPKPQLPPIPRPEPGEQVKGLVKCCDVCPEQFYLPRDYDDGLTPYLFLEKSSSSTASRSSSRSGSKRRRGGKRETPYFGSKFDGSGGCCMLCPAELPAKKPTPRTGFAFQVPFKMMLLETYMRDVKKQSARGGGGGEGRRHLLQIPGALPSTPPGPPCCSICPYNALNTLYNEQNYNTKGEPFGGVFGTGNSVRDGPWGPTRYFKGEPWVR